MSLTIGAIFGNIFAMLKMRLQRVGRKHDPSYRIIITDSKSGPKSGKSVEILGSYNPQFDSVKIEKERATYWLSQGVVPTDTVHNILVSEKILKAKKKDVSSKKNTLKENKEGEETKETVENENEEKATGEDGGVDPEVASAAKVAEEAAEEAKEATSNKVETEEKKEAPTEENVEEESKSEESVEEEPKQEQEQEKKTEEAEEGQASTNEAEEETKA